MKFENIYKETDENIRLALTSLWTPGNHPMRKAVLELFDREPLLAEPVFQSTFGWKPALGETWRQYINPTVFANIERIRERKAIEAGKQFRPFHPFTHQEESWKNLHDNKSIVVTSGTGSGKTECFMYPVISDLYEQGNQNAIQAIFLYPLNALMEDQKNRLSDYCSAANLKFAVYNGETPEYHADGRDEALLNEVRTRDEIRDPHEQGTRPQILLTNPSMLEYILVRQKDQQMLQSSARKLRWIVIDEAHSYSGSSAVELAYQIKRILDAFDVKANEVRFACTSATISGDGGEQSLASFIATVTGQSISNIKVIGGERLVPELDQQLLSNELTSRGLPSTARLLSLRRAINERQGMSLRQIWDWLRPELNFDYSRIPEALHLVDDLCELHVGNLPVLSLRGHFYMRAISGLYGCINPNCKGTSGTPYGHLTTEKATVCPHCGVPLLELVQCKKCGSFVVMGNSDSQTHVISQYEERTDKDDYFSVELTPEQEAEEIELYGGSPDTFFIVPFNREKYFNPVSAAVPTTLNIIHNNQESELVIDESGNGKWVELRKDGSHSYCPTCGKLAMGKTLNLKHFRIPISFINQTVAPVFLKECAPEGKSWGKYIAFTDSRQGTAISAKTFNIDVERIQARERLVEKLTSQEPDLASQYPGLDAAALQQIRAILSQQNAETTLTLEKVSDIIFDAAIFDHITSTDGDPDKRAYKAALIRHFIGRKPLYENDVETMGLAFIDYPAINNLHAKDSFIDLADIAGANVTDKDWQSFLKIILDYFIRVGNHIQPLISGERKYVRDSNLSTPFHAPDDPREKISGWPELKIKSDGTLPSSLHRMVTLLCAGLGLTSEEVIKVNERKINNVLKDAFNALVETKVLTKVSADDSEGYNDARYYPDGRYVGCYYLNLSGEEGNKTCIIKRPKEGWICPVTGKIMGAVFMGISPVISGEISKQLADKYRCTDKILLPQRPAENDKVSVWMETDPAIMVMKQNGLWNNRHKEAFMKKPAYIAAEHSAQQSKSLLRKYTKSFSQENPSINVLHCSTTMEMGVDIGDIDVVLMDTIPPTAANYLQRVGRAGRAGQTKAIAFSLCNNTPVGQQAFRNPMWALESTNHMRPVSPSNTIIQRHINSFFLRQFICNNGTGIQATITVGDFMESTCDAFAQYLDDISTNASAEVMFHNVFGNLSYGAINITRDSILSIKNSFNKVIDELNSGLEQFQDDEKRKIAISNQIRKCKGDNLLNYLSESQFIPNASMPTGVVTFDFTDRDQARKLHRLYNELDRLKAKMESAADESERILIREDMNKAQRSVNEIKRATTSSRDIHMALNEYAPEQTVVVNEKNYVSAGITLFGAYNDQTQSMFIYHCTHCGKTEYIPIFDEHRMCQCGHPFHSIIDPDHSAFTMAYEPVGFSADQTVDGSREESTEKRFYDIQPVLLQADWSNPSEVNMCQVSSSGEHGKILFYNVGNGAGFAFCKRCGRAAVEISKYDSALPFAVRPGHDRLWGDPCEANDGDIARHVVFTGKHQTCYSVLRFYTDNRMSKYVTDETLVYSLGVIIKRALVEFLGIDETEIGFGTKQDKDAWILFVYDTARGGCGYSLHLADRVECQKIFDIARRKLEGYNCRCHIDGGACAKCLVDRENYRYSDRLSKAAAYEWLNLQKSKIMPMPEVVRLHSDRAVSIYSSLKDILKDAVNSSEVSTITLFASDCVDNHVITDWASSRSEMGKYIHRAIEHGKSVNVKVEYHPGLHQTNVDKIPFVGLSNRFPDCNVELIADMGSVKTALIVEDSHGIKRYFTDVESGLSLSNEWGKDCVVVYSDNKQISCIHIDEPSLETSSSIVIREGLATTSRFEIKHYFSEVIARSTLHLDDVDLINNLLRGKNLSIEFSDMYVNSALCSLMLVYLIKEMKLLFGFNISAVDLHLDSRKRKCNNNSFNDYTEISYNFNNKDDADNYTDELFESVLNIVPFHSPVPADHHRWLKLVTPDGSVVEIRPDHGIGGGYKSSSTYADLDYLDGSVVAYRSINEDILYYVIIKKAEA